MSPTPSAFALPPLIDDLIALHREAVTGALALFHTHLASHPKLQPAVDQLGGVDELYALRFVLSAVSRKDKDVAGKAGSNLIDTVTWRSLHLNLFKEITSDDEHFAASYAPEFHSSYTCDLGMCPVFVTNLGLVDGRTIFEKFSSAELLDMGMRYHEVIRKALDRRTRATGRLIKMISILDMNEFSLARMNYSLLQVLGQNSKMNETFQPQLVGVAIIVKAGLLFKAFYFVFSLFLSSSSLDKIIVCGGVSHQGMTVDNCPWVNQYFQRQGVAKEIRRC